jgi:hypothetical protein
VSESVSVCVCVCELWRTSMVEVLNILRIRKLLDLCYRQTHFVVDGPLRIQNLMDSNLGQ